MFPTWQLPPFTPIYMQPPSIVPLELLMQQQVGPRHENQFWYRSGHPLILPPTQLPPGTEVFTPPPVQQSRSQLDNQQYQAPSSGLLRDRAHRRRRRRTEASAHNHIVHISSRAINNDCHPGTTHNQMGAVNNTGYGLARGPPSRGLSVMLDQEAGYQAGLQNRVRFRRKCDDLAQYVVPIEESKAQRPRVSDGGTSTIVPVASLSSTSTSTTEVPDDGATSTNQKKEQQDEPMEYANGDLDEPSEVQR